MSTTVDAGTTATHRRGPQRLISLSALWLSLSPYHVFAGLTRVEFTGSLQDITTFAVSGNSYLEPYFDIGDPVKGSLTYLTPGQLDFANQDYANYWHSLQSISISVGSYTASSIAPTSEPSDHRVQVVDDELGGGVVRDAVIFSARGGFSSGIAGLDLFNLQFAVGSLDPSALASKELPSADMINALSDIFEGNVNFVSFQGGATLRYDLLTFDAYVVPEPCSLALLCLSFPLVWWSALRTKKV